MGKHDPAYALACGIAVGSLVAFGLTSVVHDRRVQEAISRAEAPLISRVNDLEARHERVTSQLETARAEARDKALSERERDAQAVQIDAWRKMAVFVALQWELAFMKYENDRQAARWDHAGAVEQEWIQNNPPDELARTIRPAVARQLVGDGLIRDIVDAMP